MALQTSGQISLNDLHVEAGGGSGAMSAMNDSDIRGLTPASGRTINTTSGGMTSMSDFYGASSIAFMAFSPSGSYTTFTSGDYRYYRWSGVNNTGPTLTAIGTADSGRVYFKVWGGGGGGGGGGQYAGANGGVGSFTKGYWVPTSTGRLLVQTGSGGVGGGSKNGTQTSPAGGAGGYMNANNNTLRGGSGGAGYGTGGNRVGGGGGGGAGARLRTYWTNQGEAAPTFFVRVGGGGGGGGSDQSATGSTTKGGNGGAAQAPNQTGTAALDNGSSLGGLGGTGAAGGAARAGYNNQTNAEGKAGTPWHGGDGGYGISDAFGGSGGGGGGVYGGSGGSVGGGSQGVGGGGGGGDLAGSLTITQSIRQTHSSSTAPAMSELGWSGSGNVAGSGAGMSANNLGYNAGTGGNSCVVIYFKYQ